MSYSFTTADIVAAYSSNAYTGNSGNSYIGNGWLGSYNNNLSAGNNNRPAKYNGSTGQWQIEDTTNSPITAAGIVDFFLRPDDLTAGTQITYSVLLQTSSNSSLFSVGTSGTSGSSTKLLPNFSTKTTYNAGTMANASNRMWMEFGDVGATSASNAGSSGNNRYILANNNPSVTNYFNSYLSGNSAASDVYAADGTTRLYIESLPNTTFTVVLQGDNLASSMRFVFSLWGDQYAWNGSKWIEAGTKNSSLGFITMQLEGTPGVPEPGTLGLAAASLISAAVVARRRRKS